MLESFLKFLYNSTNLQESIMGVNVTNTFGDLNAVN